MGLLLRSIMEWIAQWKFSIKLLSVGRIFLEFPLNFVSHGSSIREEAPFSAGGAARLGC